MFLSSLLVFKSDGQVTSWLHGKEKYFDFLYSLERRLVEGPYSVCEQFIDTSHGFRLSAEWVMLLAYRKLFQTIQGQLMRLGFLRN